MGAETARGEAGIECGKRNEKQLEAKHSQKQRRHENCNKTVEKIPALPAILRFLLKKWKD